MRPLKRLQEGEAEEVSRAELQRLVKVEISLPTPIPFIPSYPRPKLALLITWRRKSLGSR